VIHKANARKYGTKCLGKKYFLRSIKREDYVNPKVEGLESWRSIKSFENDSKEEWDKSTNG